MWHLKNYENKTHYLQYICKFWHYCLTFIFLVTSTEKKSWCPKLGKLLSSVDSDCRPIFLDVSLVWSSTISLFLYLKLCSFKKLGFIKSSLAPGMNWQFGVQDASRNAKLLQKQFESITSLHSADKYERLSSHQAELQEGVDEQKLVLFLTFHAVLLKLWSVRQLWTLKLQRNLQQMTTFRFRTIKNT